MEYFFSVLIDPLVNVRVFFVSCIDFDMIRFSQGVIINLVDSFFMLLKNILDLLILFLYVSFHKVLHFAFYCHFYHFFQQFLLDLSHDILLLVLNLRLLFGDFMFHLIDGSLNHVVTFLYFLLQMFKHI